VDTGIGHQVGLELRDIDVQGTIETKGSSERRDDLSNETIQVSVGGTLDVKVTTANIVDGLVVKHNSDIGVLEERVGGKHRVVGLNNSGSDLGRGPGAEVQLGLLAVIDGKTLKEQAAKTGTGTTTDSVEHQETLETSAVICELADTVEDKVDDFLADSVVTTGEVVSGIFLARNQLLRVEQLAVGTSANLIDDSGLKVHHHAARHVLASAGFREEGVEGIITATDGLIGGHLAIRLDTVLEAEELPAGITELNTSLTNVDSNALTHF